MTALDAYQSWRAAQTLLEQERWKKQLWDFVRPSVEKIAARFEKIARQNGVWYQREDLITEAYLKYEQVLPHFEKYDLSQESAILRILDTAVRRHFLDICAPNHKKENVPESKKPPVSLDALIGELADTTETDDFVLEGIDPESLREVLADLIQCASQQGLKEEHILLLRLWLHEPPLKSVQIAKILHRSPSWVTNAAPKAFGVLQECLKEHYPDIVTLIQRLPDARAETRGRKAKTAQQEKARERADSEL